MVYLKSRFLKQADFLRCQDTYLCTKNRHRVYYVENSVDNHFSLWITLCHIVFNTMSLLVYSVRCPSVNRGAVLSGRGAVTQHDGKNLFCALFLIFSKNFSVLKTSVFACFRLFYEPLRARAFSLSLKKTAQNFFEKGVDKGVHPRYNGDTPRGYTPRPPDSVEGRADSPNGVHLVNSRSPRGQHSADRRRV